MAWLNQHTELIAQLERRRRSEYMRDRVGRAAPMVAVGTMLAGVAVAAVLIYGGSHPGPNATNPFDIRQATGATSSVPPVVAPVIPSSSGTVVPVTPSPTVAPSPTVPPLVVGHAVQLTVRVADRRAVDLDPADDVDPTGDVDRSGGVQPRDAVSVSRGRLPGTSTPWRSRASRCGTRRRHRRRRRTRSSSASRSIPTGSHTVSTCLGRSDGRPTGSSRSETTTGRSA